MKLRKLARLCEHDELTAHRFVNGTTNLHGTQVAAFTDCPGGVFLPDDTLTINRQALVLMGAERFYVVQVRDDGSYPMPLFDFLEALTAPEPS